MLWAKHCAYENCADDLINYRGAVFVQYMNKPMVPNAVFTTVTIQNQRNTSMSTASAAMEEICHSTQTTICTWFSKNYTKASWKPAWVSANVQTEQPHDEPMEEVEYKNYFSAPRFYCVETICAPCGVVVAWAKFPKAESPTNFGIFGKGFSHWRV